MRLRSANTHRGGDGAGMKSEVRGQLCFVFSPDNLTFVGGVYPCRRNKRRNPKNKKGGREQNPCHECHLCRSVFPLLFFFRCSSRRSCSLSLSLSHSPPRSLSLSFPVEYGFEADREERRNERTTARRRVYTLMCAFDANPSIHIGNVWWTRGEEEGE